MAKKKRKKSLLASRQCQEGLPLEGILNWPGLYVDGGFQFEKSLSFTWSRRLYDPHDRQRGKELSRSSLLLAFGGSSALL